MNEDEHATRRRDRDRAQRPDRPSGNPLASIDYSRPKYPHDIHPALVPGIAIDEQRRRYGVDKIILGVAGVLTVAFVIWGIVNPASVGEVADAAYAWTMTHLGWLFNAVASVVLVAMLILALSRYGKIPLGKDGEKPEFSTFSWVAMLFAAGLGIGVMFWGPSEPLTYFITPPPLTNDPETVEALHQALAQTYYHWGFHAWAMYALVGGAVAYAAYRRGRTLLMSSIFERLFGKRLTDGWAGQLVDIFAIIATLFGTAAALGIAVLQIGEGVVIVSGASELTNTVMVLIIAVLSIGFVISAVSGVSRGIRYLSNTNIVLTIGFAALLFILGPTLFLLNMLPSAVMEYVGSLFEMMARSASWGQETLDFQSAWTVYYWAWWISWSPFVGVFIARISRGRTIRQFILGVILIPSALLFVAYGVMGGTAISMYRDGKLGEMDTVQPAQVLFSMVENLPLAGVFPVLIMAILAIFFITAADSASVVMGIFTTRGGQDPPKLVVVFWGLVMGGIALVMLLLGDETALEGLQSLVIITAVPFAFVMLLIIVAWVRELRTDPLALRQQYAEVAVSNAVVDGVDRYDDDFSLQVIRTEPGEGAGAEVDSTHEDYTEWYQRTDEEGDPVGFDFATGQWADGWNPETGEVETVDPDAVNGSSSPEGDPEAPTKN
ncbi:BCCT family transporter [Brachybacterium fresconis]|uniref:Choline/carnitine/betaine transport n=1 Tax=Brachybacterium fresconis TaxID=173363 RepID=A0ABS4YIG8_9MICO|nr:BCCT family transporter [Brachybacterium fresconis]MBP2408405.1 choline/carnitine/betaine transport [Brachybacterium fresconis]